MKYYKQLYKWNTQRESGYMINLSANVKLHMQFVNDMLYGTLRASLVAQLAKNPPAMQETWVWSLSWEDPLENGTATHSSILAWRVLWTL